MQINYTGKTDELLPVQREQLQAKYDRLAKMMDGKGEKGAHVILSQERTLHRAEITANFLDHMLVGVATDPELSVALSHAVDRLESQVIRLRAKRRDGKRDGRGDRFLRATDATGGAVNTNGTALVAAEPHEGEVIGGKRVYRIDDHRSHKPMTVEEALMEIEDGRDYVAYCDMATKELAVLIRRRDGDFDLVEL